MLRTMQWSRSLRSSGRDGLVEFYAAVRAVNLRDGSVGWSARQANGGQFFTPDATRIQADDVVADDQAERRPMAEDDGYVRCPARWDVEPRQASGRSGIQRAARREIHLPLSATKTQPGERIAHHAQALGGFEFRFPSIRLVAVEACERFFPRRRSKGALEFIGEFEGCRDVPLRQHSRVDHEHVVLEM